MQRFESDGVEIAFAEAGEGPPVLFIHGFASSGDVNWRDTGWFKTMAEAGFRAIAIDNRGHGRSQKLYRPADYSAAIMAEDARRLLDHLGIPRADVVGYSMGARIAALLAIAHPDRVRRVIFAGLAANMIHEVAGAEDIARGLEAPSIDDVSDPNARSFRRFAEQTKSDLLALAACMRSSRQKIVQSDLATIAVPVLVVAGERDEIAGPLAPLVDIIPGARGVSLARRDHMNAVGDRAFKDAVVAFLSD